MMRARSLAFAAMFALSSPALSSSGWAQTPADTSKQSPKAAVFDFELADTSLEGEKNGPQADEQARLLKISDQLRKGLAESGKFAIVDISPVNTAAHNSNLQACGECDVDFAKKLAD